MQMGKEEKGKNISNGIEKKLLEYIFTTKWSTSFKPWNESYAQMFDT